jgi:hypothetical protein
MILREARTEDRPVLVGFMAALQDFERGMEPNRLPGAEMADRHLAVLEAWAQAHPCGGLLVAEVEGSLAGFIIFGVEEEFGTYVPRRRSAWAGYPTCGSSPEQGDAASPGR